MHPERKLTIELPWQWTKTMFFIPASDEQFVIKEVLIDECYAFDFKPTDVVLNLWGNIWAFDVFAYDRVKEIITFEPDVNCFEKLSRHLYINGIHNVYKNNMAMSYYDWEIDILIWDQAWHNTCVWEWNTKVQCADINRICAFHQPNKIKCDIEWYEYELFEHFEIPDYVDEIWMETHTFSQEQKEKHFELKCRLVSDGFKVEEINNDEYERTYLLHAKR